MANCIISVMENISCNGDDPIWCISLACQTLLGGSGAQDQWYICNSRTFKPIESV